MERPTLRQLEILAEVARIGTFRGAARHLGLSQVAVSDHIRQLESRLGCALFVRNAGGKPTLSLSGKVVLGHGRNVLFACDALISAARGAAEGVKESDSVEPLVDSLVKLDYAANLNDLDEVVLEQDALDSCREQGSDISPSVDAFVHEPAIMAETVSVAEPVPISLQDVMKVSVPEPSFISREEEPQEQSVREVSPAGERPINVASHPAILSRFQDKLAAAQEAFPDRPIGVDFARFTPDAVLSSLASGEVDIALFYALGEVPGLPSEYLWSENWSLFARADHPLAQVEMLHLADCVDMPVILFEESNPLRALCEACLVKAGLWPAPTVLETDDFAAIVTELLEYGEAVFPAFGVTAAQFAARQGLKRLALVEPLPNVQVRRAVAPIAEDDPTIAALAGLLG